MNAILYMKKMRERESEIIWKDGPLTDAEKLELIICSIQPYSKWWRWGYIKALRRAIKLIKEDDNKQAKRKNETKKFDVWIEGYMATGESAPHRFIGTAEAETFKEASYIALKKWRESLGCNDIDEYYNPEHNTFWGMRCFDNETDAAKSFG